MLTDHEKRLSGLETQQSQVISDATGATGDPVHGHAVVVIGLLPPITGLKGYGLAVYQSGAWHSLAAFTYP